MSVIVDINFSRGLRFKFVMLFGNTTPFLPDWQTGVYKDPCRSLTVFLSNLIEFKVSEIMSTQRNIADNSAFSSLIITMALFNEESFFLTSCSLMKALKACLYNSTSLSESANSFCLNTSMCLCSPARKGFSVGNRVCVLSWGLRQLH